MKIYATMTIILVITFAVVIYDDWKYEYDFDHSVKPVYVPTHTNVYYPGSFLVPEKPMFDEKPEFRFSKYTIDKLVELHGRERARVIAGKHWRDE